jgi:DNA-binding SARP family transcriptional activator
MIHANNKEKKTMEQSSADVIQITMLSGFAIEMGKSRITDMTSRTHQLWHLIEYLITFRGKTVTQDELIDVLWPEGEIDNPANALKNLIYRVRSALAAQGFALAKDMIVYTRGGYCWNNDLPCVVDCEEFERLHKLASAPGLAEENRMNRYLDAVEIYKGDFLPGARFESWVVPIASRYHSMYFECVYQLLEIMAGRGEYAAMEDICARALLIDQFEEPVHRYLLVALIRQGKQAAAMAHYSATIDLLFRELGVTPSPEMRSLYREIARTPHDVEIDLNVIKEDLRESEKTSGAYYCEYEVFKSMYRQEARAAARTARSIYICLLTVEDADGKEMEIKALNKAMDGLYDIVQSSLRRGDVYSRYSECQYVLMVPALTFENCTMVMDRITNRFRAANRGKTISAYAKIQPLDPADR